MWDSGNLDDTERSAWMDVLCVTHTGEYGTGLPYVFPSIKPLWFHLKLTIDSSVFITSLLAALATSDRSEQAVTTSTLMLWRSIGTVLGIAASSLILQNALLYFLEHNVVGPDKDAVIAKVRTSVSSIADLDWIYREQVVQSYAMALRATFVAAAVLSVVCAMVVLAIKVPRLQRKNRG